MSQYEALFTSSIPDSPGNPWRVQRSRLQTDQPRHNPWHSDLHSSGSVTTMAEKSKFHFLNVWPCIIITIVLVGDKENGLVDKHRVHFRTFFRINLKLWTQEENVGSLLLYIFSRSFLWVKPWLLAVSCLLPHLSGLHFKEWNVVVASWQRK